MAYAKNRRRNRAKCARRFTQRYLALVTALDIAT